MDEVPYRFGRIGFVMLVRLLALGRPERFPGAMVWLVLGSLAALAFVLATMAQTQGLSAALGGLVLLIPGFWQSLQSALPEPCGAAAYVLFGTYDAEFIRASLFWPT